MPDVTSFSYYLPLTCIRIQASGARSWAVDWNARTMHPVITHDAVVTTSATADVRHRGKQELCLETNQLHDADLKISFYPDGRLKSVNATNRAPRRHHRIGCQLVGTALGATRRRQPSHTARLGTRCRGETSEGYGAGPLYKSWSDEFPAHAQRGEKLSTLLAEMDKKLEENAQLLASDKPSSDAAKAWEDVRAVRDKLAADLAAIEQAASSWLEAQEPALHKMDRLLSLDEVIVLRSKAGELAQSLPETLDKPPEPRFQSEFYGMHITVLAFSRRRFRRRGRF